MSNKFLSRLCKVIIILSIGAMATTVVNEAPPVVVRAERMEPQNKITEISEYGFTDINKEWMKLPVRWGTTRGIISGYKDKTFRPENQVREAEFATMMARYVKIVDLDHVVEEKGKHWSQIVYDELGRYGIPLRGYKSNKAKDTGLSRGQMARIIAAKNGFNLNERQAIYYLYENDLSTGKIAGVKDLESYDAKAALKRAEAVAFLQRLDSAGVTTFKGKPSDVGADEIGGIVGVPEDGSDVDFGDFGPSEKYMYAKKIADKYGKIYDEFDAGYAIKGNGGLVRYNENSRIHVNNYASGDKEIFIDVLRGLGVSEKGIKEVIHIIEVEHKKNSNIPEYIKFTDGHIEVTGSLSHPTDRSLSLQFGFYK